MEVTFVPNRNGVAMNAPANIRFAGKGGGFDDEREGEGIGEDGGGKHLLVKREGFGGAVVQEGGTEDGVPEEGGAGVRSGEEDGEGIGEEVEAGVDGDETGGEEGGGGVVVEEDLGVGLLGMVSGGAPPEKKVKGVGVEGEVRNGGVAAEAMNHQSICGLQKGGLFEKVVKFYVKISKWSKYFVFFTFLVLLI